MERIGILVVFGALLSFSVAYPADHREDTVLPFNLSPGNVNLEKYYLNKYPPRGESSGGNKGPVAPAAETPPLVESHDDNTFLDQDEDGLSRVKRKPQHHHHGHHHHGGGFGFYQPNYGSYNDYNPHRYQHYNPHYNHHGGGHHHGGHHGGGHYGGGHHGGGHYGGGHHGGGHYG